MARLLGWRKLRFRFDWTLAVATVVVGALGLVNLWSAVADRTEGSFGRQVAWMGLGALAFLAAATPDYRLFARLGYSAYGIGVGLLVFVKLFGRSVGGSQRWFHIGPAHLQPSEPMKVLVILALARYLNDAPVLEGRTARHLTVPLILAGAPVLLIAAQPDLGTAMLVALIFITILLTARLNLKTLAGMAAIALVAAVPIWNYAMKDYQRNRFLAFIHPELSPDTAWQPRMALNAVGSGRLLGKGFMHGTQIRIRKLPALETDFPLAVWAEEWGFVGSAAVLLAYAFLTLWVIKIAAEARDRFGAALCVGVAALLFWQVVINIGMVVGVLPVVGVTLPLISYGGSSVLTIMVALGLVMNVSVRRFSY